MYNVYNTLLFLIAIVYVCALAIIDDDDEKHSV